MDDKEVEDWLNAMYPIGKERWVKLRYLDRDKAMKHIRMHNNSPQEGSPEEQELGYMVTAIGLMDEFNPQISAIMDLRGNIIGGLVNVIDQYQLDHVDSIFLAKIQELKNNTIEYAEYNSDPIKHNQLVIDQMEDGTWRVLMGDSELQQFGKEDYHKMQAMEFIYNRSTCFIKE